MGGATNLKMTGYIVKRLLMVIPTILFVTSTIFILIQLIPGDVITNMLVDFQYRYSERDMESVRESLGIDVPIYVQYFRKAYGLKTSIVRPSNIYGPRQNPDSEAGVIAIFIKSMLEKQKLNIFGDGDDKRDYIYVSDVVKGCLLAEKKSLNQPLNLGTGLSTSVNDLFQTISKLCNYNLQPNYCDRRPGDVTNITLDSSAGKRLLGWDIKINLEEGLRKTFESFKTIRENNTVENDR